MNLHSVDSVRSGVNAGACVVRERGPAWDSWPIGPTRVHGLARFSAESGVLTPPILKLQGPVVTKRLFKNNLVEA